MVVAALEHWSQHRRVERERERGGLEGRDGAWRSVAWRVARLGVARCGVARFCRGEPFVLHGSLSLSIPRALRNALVAALRCVVALCRQSVAVAAPVRWDCAIGRVSKIEI